MGKVSYGKMVIIGAGNVGSAILNSVLRMNILDNIVVVNRNQKKALGEVVQDSLSEENNTGIQVYIGNETPVSSMKDCSVVTANYELGEGIRGTIGIIGPKRMDYERVLSTLKHLMKQLDATYKNEES